MTLIDGKKVADQIKEEIGATVEKWLPKVKSARISPQSS